MKSEKYDDFPVKTEFRDKLLRDLAELAVRGGRLQVENVIVEVEVEADNPTGGGDD